MIQAVSNLDRLGKSVLRIRIYAFGDCPGTLDTKQFKYST